MLVYYSLSDYFFKMSGPAMDSGGLKRSSHCSSNSDTKSRNTLQKFNRSIAAPSTQVPRILFLFWIIFTTFTLIEGGRKAIFFKVVVQWDKTVYSHEEDVTFNFIWYITARTSANAIYTQILIYAPNFRWCYVSLCGKIFIEDT